ncbi:EAL domain-containing protein [Gracilibacillus caseinilyticus]|uniref:EAL domain-containing protein n=1 Tax=Gracilibacillus caseinilyticus TaxID=2932256 RepID=A0ABY4ET53_9BACI|nr:EAL domain-containing protein [Gracilibacillus caseinilyticus]UOQ47052.1 EAL domain-containing protein [Gracilibacillus caseinilyticus]
MIIPTNMMSVKLGVAIVKSALRITSVYVLIGVLWILFSDFSNIILQRLASALWIDQHTFMHLIFLTITSCLLYYLIRILTKKYEKELQSRIVTELLATESLEENQRLLHLFDQISSGIILVDPDQADDPIVYVNKGFEEITGYTADEVVGRNCRILHGRNTREEDITSVQKALNQFQSVQVEIKNYKKNGDEFWNELKIKPVMNKEKRFLIGIQNDITEKKNQSVLVENQFLIVKKLLEQSDKQKAFREVCKIVDEQTGYQSLIFQKDIQTMQLRTYATYSLPQEFLDELIDFPIKKKEGISGEAAFYNKTIIIDNLLSLENTKYVDLSQRYGIQTIWSTPINTSTDDVIGVFTLYRKNLHTPSEQEIRALETYAYIIGQVMENLNFQETIKESNYRFRLIAENTTDIICLINAKKDLQYVSPSIKQLIGNNISRHNIEKMFSDTSKQTIQYLIHYLLYVKEEDNTEIEVTDHRGHLKWLDVKGKRVVDQNNETSLLFLARDVTSRKQYQESLDRILYFDPVTQLPNKYKLRKELDYLVQAKYRFNLLLLDFDQMKEIKSMYGIKAWDYVMMEMSKRLRDHFQPIVLARSGEDEFCLITKLTKKQLERVMLKFFDKLRLPWRYEEQEFLASVSIGVVCYEKQTADMMILQGQEALQIAKSFGKNQFYFYFNDQANDKNRELHIKRYLYQAMDQKELELYYQPQIDLKKGEITGLEALLRWNNQQLGVVSPGEFIGVAEETGWIVPISDYVMEKIVDDIVKWNKQGHYFHVSINISYKQMKEADFVDKVKNLLGKKGCPAQQISFEITESLLLEDLELSLHLLHQLHTFGIGIEVDDFGVGYSSLAYLKKFPIDVLKIDRSFVMDLFQDHKNTAILQAIMEMSKALELSVIAEGVENFEQIKLLEELGCQIFQGYWFSRPVKQEELISTIHYINQEKLTAFSL